MASLPSATAWAAFPSLPARACLGSTRTVLLVAAGHGVADVAVLPLAALGKTGLHTMVAAMRPRTGIVCATRKESDGDNNQPDDVARMFSELDDIKSHLTQKLNAAAPEPRYRNENLQQQLQEVATESGTLLREVATRLRPAAGTKLSKDLTDIGVKMLGVEVSARTGRAPWGYAQALCCELYGLRNLVSSTLGVPIPRSNVEISEFMLENNDVEVTLLAMLHGEYYMVSRDIQAMLG